MIAFPYRPCLLGRVIWERTCPNSPEFEGYEIIAVKPDALRNRPHFLSNYILGRLYKESGKPAYVTGLHDAMGDKFKLWRGFRSLESALVDFNSRP